MSTEIATPPAAPAAAPAKPAGPVTPAIPAAQKASQPQVPAPAKTLPKTVSVEEGLRKVREEVFKGEGEGTVTPETAALLTETPLVEPKKVDAATKPVATTAPAAEAKPAPVAPEKDPFDHITAPEGMTEKSLTGWKALKKEASEKVSAAEKKYNDAIAQLETYKKATPADVAESERLKTELKQARDALAIYDLRRDPDFQRQYVEPKNKALTEAKQLLADNAVEDAPEVSDLLGKTRIEFAKTVSELASKMPAFDQGSFVASMREAYRLHGEENGALAKSNEVKQNFEAKRAQVARQAFEETRGDVSAKVPEMAIPEGASDELVSEITSFNKMRTEAMAEAEQYSFSKIDEKQVAKIAHQAAMLKPVATVLIPSLQRSLKKSNDLVAELTAELAAIKKGKQAPQFTESGGSQAQPTQNRNAKQPDFGAVAREVGMR